MSDGIFLGRVRVLDKVVEESTSTQRGGVSQPGGAPCVIPSCIVFRAKLLVKWTVAYEECNGASLFAA